MDERDERNEGWMRGMSGIEGMIEGRGLPVRETVLSDRSVVDVQRIAE